VRAEVKEDAIAAELPPDPITVPLANTVAPVAPAAATVPTFVAPEMIACNCDADSPLPVVATLQRSVDGLYVSPTDAQKAGTVLVGEVVDDGAGLQ
jgi:hypothetical protein